MVALSRQNHPDFPWDRVSRALAAGMVLTLAFCSVGCGGARSLELSGSEATGRLPEDVRDLIPAETILCHDEEAQGGAYRLWILRRPNGEWLDFPKRKGKGLERHVMPQTALASILQAKLPSLERGVPIERNGRYTHWTGSDGAEIQVREIKTDQGWFASVERVRM